MGVRVMTAGVSHLRGLMRPDGSKYSIAFPTAIWAIGETNITALKMSNLGRIR
jgi:hypothetical protein